MLFILTFWVKKMSMSKQQVLCTTSPCELTIETMIEGQCQTVQWVMVSTKWPPFMVQCGKILYCDLAKGSRSKIKSQDQNKWSCAQLHRPSELLEPWSKDNVKRLKEVQCPKVPPPPVLRTYTRTDWRAVDITRSIPATPGDKQLCLLIWM